MRLKPGSTVALSACESGLIRPYRTDEYLGLPSGFLFAGAASVLGSLWTVDDKCTAQLMEKTYAGIINQGLSLAASLRRAQLAVKSDPRYLHPYYWAPFHAIGNAWHPLLSSTQ